MSLCFLFYFFHLNYFQISKVILFFSCLFFESIFFFCDVPEFSCKYQVISIIIYISAPFAQSTPMWTQHQNIVLIQYFLSSCISTQEVLFQLHTSFIMLLLQKLEVNSIINIIKICVKKLKIAKFIYMNTTNVKLLVWEPSYSQIMKGLENYHSLICGLFLSPTHKSNLHIYLHLKYLIQPLYTPQTCVVLQKHKKLQMLA